MPDNFKEFGNESFALLYCDLTGITATHITHAGDVSFLRKKAYERRVLFLVFFQVGVFLRQVLP